MVAGLDKFRDYFADDTDKYVLIGGAACDTVFKSNDTAFRATKDLDMVLIMEALTPDFGEKLPDAVRKDLLDFISALDNDPFDVNTLINYGVSTQEVIERLSAIFL